MFHYKMKVFFIVLICAVFVNCYKKGDFIGCHDLTIKSKSFKQDGIIVSSCINTCSINYYSYAMVQERTRCSCTNFLGSLLNATTKCEVCDTCNKFASDVYATGEFGLGPPHNLQVQNVTATSAHITYEEPESYTYIDSFRVKANVIKTYSKLLLINPDLIYSNDTFQIRLILLQPSSTYNITVQAMYTNRFGAAAYKIIETKIDVPDISPTEPEIIEHKGDKMTIKMRPVTNNNGPISAYQVIVINESAKQTFHTNDLVGFKKAQQDEIGYYIAAELKPEDIEREFIVGDGKMYGNYYNSPLNPESDYHIVLAVVSHLNGDTKIAYSNYGNSSQHGLFIVNTVTNNEVDSPGIIIGLSIAIGFLSVVLVATLVGFLILKRRLASRRVRLADNQELALQGPMIEIENSAYIPEEECRPINHYANLKQKVRNIPSHVLKVDITNVIGHGKFGLVNVGSILDGDETSVAVYTVYDKKLQSSDKLQMIKDLDLLIRCGRHENVLTLIGTNETHDVVNVVLEHVSTDLKNLLLGSRDPLPERFSNMSESQAIKIAINIAKGMAHLENQKIVHKQLCARNIMITADIIPKISGFGLTQIFNRNKVPDYTRWTATEVFQGFKHTFKSDVWSFACILWEICTLGGTPYGNISNSNELPEKIKRGLRLPQMPYVSDELYQLMLYCWQLDMDERPTFANLVEQITDLTQDLPLHLNFNLYPNFQYEQFYIDMELVARKLY